MLPHPDPHGQAALMLCESLVLLLIENRILEKDRITEAIEGIIEIKREIAGVSEDVVVGIKAIGLLQALSRSLSAVSIPAAIEGARE